jgi:hypothetical protein
MSASYLFAIFRFAIFEYPTSGRAEARPLLRLAKWRSPDNHCII